MFKINLISIWLNLLRAYLRLGLFFYFKEIRVINTHNIPRKGPLLLLSNHQNGLLDALLIAATCKRFAFFLTRASVFKSSLVSRLLKMTRLIPVYRIRDGWNTLTNNQEVFENCAQLLQNGQAIVIFPEGNHHLDRTVRPLSRGFTRVVSAAFEENPSIDLKLLPIGLNYESQKKFPDRAAIFYGETINAQQFSADVTNDMGLALKQKIQSEIQQLTTHIPAENYDEILSQLEALEVDFLNPKSINECIANNFINGSFDESIRRKSIVKIFKPLLIVCLILPYLIWKYLVEPKITEPEFISTFRFALAITLVPVWIICLGLLSLFFLGWHMAVFSVLTILGLAILTTKT